MGKRELQAAYSIGCRAGVFFEWSIMKYEFEKVGKFTMISIDGNLEVSETAKKLDDEISDISQNGQHHFVFNLVRTVFLDSAGAAIFIRCLCDVQENGGSVFIIAEDNQVRRMLDTAGLSRLITTYESKEDFINAQDVSIA